MSRWIRHGVPAAVSALLGASAGLLGNMIDQGWRWPTGTGFTVAVTALVLWEGWRGIHDGEAHTVVQARPAAEAAESGIHNLPALPGDCFVGREAILEELHRGWGAGKGAIGQALYGLGGVGKSAVALHYAWTHRSDYTVIWWVDAETGEQAMAGVAGLAGRLRQASTLSDRYAWAVDWLRSNDGWLLILDNVEDPVAVSALLGAVRGRVLVTTRRDLGDVIWHRYRLTPMRLDVLDRAASVKLLLDLAGAEHKTADAQRLAADLGDLPLALTQAGTYIGQRHLTIDAYAARVTHRPELTYAATALGTDTERAVVRVWGVTMETVTSLAPLTAAIMAVVSWLGAEQIPADVLAAWPTMPSSWRMR